MKSYTDLEQSKKLAEILPIESADGFWEYHDKWRSEGDEWEGYEDYPRAEPYLEYTRKKNEWKEDKSDVPCWSLAALLNVIPYTIYKSDNEFYRLGIDKGYNDYAVWYNNNGFTITDLDVTSDNFVDACVEMIIKLHEQKLL